MILHRVGQCSSVQYSIVQCSSLQCSEVQCSPVQSITRSDVAQIKQSSPQLTCPTLLMSYIDFKLTTELLNKNLLFRLQCWIQCFFPNAQVVKNCCTITHLAHLQIQKRKMYLLNVSLVQVYPQIGFDTFDNTMLLILFFFYIYFLFLLLTG